jgi:hypothetical protein
MAKLSISRACIAGFVGFKKHFFLMVAVGLSLGAINWSIRYMPLLTGKQLGVYEHSMSGQKIAQVEEKIQKPLVQEAQDEQSLYETLYSAGQDVVSVIKSEVSLYTHKVSTFNYLIVLFVWLAFIGLWIFLYLGAIRIFIDVIDKKKTRYEQLFSQAHLMPSYIGITVLYTGLMFCIVVGASLVTGILSLVLDLVLAPFGVNKFTVLVIGSIVGILLFVLLSMRYLFVFYCLVDKQTSMFKSFSCTHTLSRNHIFKLVLLLFVLSLPLLPFSFFKIAFPFNQMISDMIIRCIFALGGVFYGLCFAQAYRDLAKKS